MTSTVPSSMGPSSMVTSSAVTSSTVACPSVSDHPGVTASVLRPLLGLDVIVQTASSLWCGTLLSYVKDSAWFVVDDVDVVVQLDDLVSVRAA
jgi:hypothetical protein